MDDPWDLDLDLDSTRLDSLVRGAVLLGFELVRTGLWRGGLTCTSLDGPVVRVLVYRE